MELETDVKELCREREEFNLYGQMCVSLVVHQAVSSATTPDAAGAEALTAEAAGGRVPWSSQPGPRPARLT